MGQPLHTSRTMSRTLAHRQRRWIVAAGTFVVVAVIAAVGVAAGIMIEGSRKDTVHYHGRDYIYPDTLSTRKLRLLRRELRRVSGSVNGLPVLISRKTPRGSDPTVIYLVEADGGAISYGLSGGP